MRSKTFVGTAAVFILAFFFLPWFSVSLNDRVLGQFSGYQLAVGGGDYAIDGLNGRSLLFLIPTLALFVLVLLIIEKGKPAWQTFAAGGFLVSALLGIFILIWQFRVGGINPALTFSIELGFILTMICFVAIMSGAVLIFMDGLRSIKSLSETTFSSSPVPPSPVEAETIGETAVAHSAAATQPHTDPEHPRPPVQMTTKSLYKIGSNSDDPSIFAWMIVQDGNQAGEKFRIVPPIRIGRDPGNDIVIDDNSMSGYHAVIREQGGVFHIQDLNSTNGIYLENQTKHQWQRVPAATMMNDMRIKLGRTIFQVVIEV
jgi:hypothetical protein